MRTLTPAETLVIAALLASDRRSQRELIEVSGLPSRTFEAAARRLLSEGWVYDRYLPNPSRFGFPIATFSVTHPYEDRRDEVIAASRRATGLVLEWETPDWVFGVSLAPPGPPRRYRPPPAVSPALVSRSFVLSADSRVASVPAFFDFEGAWSSVSGAPRSPGYPRPLPGAGERATAEELDHRLVSDRVAALHLFDRNPPESVPTGARRRRSPLFFSRRERGALARRVSEHRVFLDVTRVPPTRTQRITGVVLLHGSLKVRRPEPLFVDLVERCGVAPFLYATDGRRVLIGTLSATAADGRPLPRAGEPVMPTLSEYLEAVEIHRSASEALTVSVDHDYSRAFGPRARPRTSSPGVSAAGATARPGVAPASRF